MSLSAAHLCSIHTFCASLMYRFTRILYTGAQPCSRVQCHLLPAARRRLAIHETFASLVELIAGSINNDALHAANSAQNSDDDSSEDTEPGCPEVPAAWARLLDGQPEHGGKAVGRGTKAQSTNEPQQVSKERDCHSCMHGPQSHAENKKLAIMRGNHKMSMLRIQQLCSNCYTLQSSSQTGACRGPQQRRGVVIPMKATMMM